MTISLAFLAPDLVKAAIEGRLPHGMGVARLADMPAEWSRQHQMLGLTFGVTGIRTESPPVAVSVSGKRDFGARDKSRRNTCRLHDAVSENEPSHRTPPIRGPLRTLSGNLR